MNIDWSKQDMRVSRTEIKKAHERLQALSEPLTKLSKKQLANLPVSEYFLDELKHLTEIDSHTAKNRQIKRVGKLIIEETATRSRRRYLSLFLPPSNVLRLRRGLLV